MGNSSLQKEAPEEVPVIDADCSGLSREPERCYAAVEATIVDKGGTNGDDFEHFDGSGFGIGEARLGLGEGQPSLYRAAQRTSVSFPRRPACATHSFSFTACIKELQPPEQVTRALIFALAVIAR